MASVRDAGDFDAPLGWLVEPDLGRLATQLAAVAGLSPAEGAALLLAVRDSLLQVLHTKLDRLLILELHAALSGAFRHPTVRPAGMSSWPWPARPLSLGRAGAQLSGHAGPGRIRRIVEARCAAGLEFAQALAADRPHLDVFHGAPLGALNEARMGAGDSHQQGRTVVVLQFEGGQLVYKPRSLRIDARLRELVQDLASRHSGGSSMRVPRVLERGAHGWAEFVSHEHAQGPGELRGFYQGIGHWLALMRLLSGSDLHAENLIAHRDAAVVVDCETLFTPNVPHPPSGMGQAADQAARLAAGTVLNVGLLPGRGQALGWRGLDSSALGSLPGQQPRILLPAILQAPGSRPCWGPRVGRCSP